MCLVAPGSKSKEGYVLGVHSCQSQMSPKMVGRSHILIVFGWDKNVDNV